MPFLYENKLRAISDYKVGILVVTVANAQLVQGLPTGCLARWTPVPRMSVPLACAGGRGNRLAYFSVH